MSFLPKSKLWLVTGCFGHRLRRRVELRRQLGAGDQRCELMSTLSFRTALSLPLSVCPSLSPTSLFRCPFPLPFSCLSLAWPVCGGYLSVEVCVYIPVESLAFTHRYERAQRGRWAKRKIAHDVPPPPYDHCSTHDRSIAQSSSFH